MSVENIVNSLMGELRKSDIDNRKSQNRFVFNWSSNDYSSRRLSSLERKSSSFRRDRGVVSSQNRIPLCEEDSDLGLYFLEVVAASLDIAKEIYGALKLNSYADGSVQVYRLCGSRMELGVMARSFDDAVVVLRKWMFSSGFGRDAYQVSKVEFVPVDDDLPRRSIGK